jgi:hypothetical protein
MQPDWGISRSNWELRENGEMLHLGLLDTNRGGQVVAVWSTEPCGCSPYGGQVAEHPPSRMYSRTIIP